MPLLHLWALALACAVAAVVVAGGAAADRWLPAMQQTLTPTSGQSLGMIHLHHTMALAHWRSPKYKRREKGEGAGNSHSVGPTSQPRPLTTDNPAIPCGAEREEVNEGGRCETAVRDGCPRNVVSQDPQSCLQARIAQHNILPDKGKS